MLGRLRRPLPRLRVRRRRRPRLPWPIFPPVSRQRSIARGAIRTADRLRAHAVVAVVLLAIGFLVPAVVGTDRPTGGLRELAVTFADPTASPRASTLSATGRPTPTASPQPTETPGPTPPPSATPTPAPIVAAPPPPRRHRLRRRRPRGGQPRLPSRRLRRPTRRRRRADAVANGNAYAAAEHPRCRRIRSIRRARPLQPGAHSANAGVVDHAELGRRAGGDLQGHRRRRPEQALHRLGDEHVAPG